MRAKCWRSDVSQTTSFWRSIYICQLNPVLQVYSFHFKSTNERSETVVTDKHEFQGRKESKFIAQFRIIRTIKILMQGPNSAVFQGDSLPLIESFQLRPWWNKSSKYLWRNEVIENRALSKLMATFPVYPSIRILTKGRKAKNFPWKTLGRKRGFRYRPGLKKKTRVFLEKSESQLQWIPILFVRSSMWKFQSVMFQQIDFRTSCVFSYPGETRGEKNWRSSKKFNNLPLSSENLTDLWLQLSRKIENTQPRWQPTYVINKS